MAAPEGVMLITDTNTPNMVQFARRWAGFVAAIWLMALSGTYGFSNYSTALKEVLGLNQEQLNRLSVAKDLGDAFGIFAGLLCNYLPAWALLCIGATVSFLGNGVQWLVVSQIIDPLPYWTMFIAAMLSGNAISWMNTSVFTLSVRNFPRNRGPVSGLFKAYMGLSAAIFSNFCDNFFSSSSSMYLLMLMTIPTAFCLLAAIFLRPVSPSETPEEMKAEEQSLFIFTIMSVALALVIILQSVVPGANEGVARPVLMILLFVSLVSPALVPLVLFFKTKRGFVSGMNLNIVGIVDMDEDKMRRASLDETDMESTDVSSVDMEKDVLRKPLLDQSDDFEDSSRHDGALAPANTKSRWLPWTSLRLGEDWPTLSLFKTWHAYLLYISLFCGAGSGMSFSNNLGQVGQSFGFSTATLFTSLFSLGNFFGRIGSGGVSEYFLKMMGTPRPLWLGVAKVPMIALFAWLSTGSAASLYVGTLLVGFAHGSIVTLAVPTVSEFYGLKYFGMNYMVISTHILAGSTVFSGIVAGYLYDQHATSEGSDGTLTCYGASCYGTTFLLYAGCLTVALFIDGGLSFFSRPLYRQLRDINTHANGAVPKQTSHKV